MTGNARLSQLVFIEIAFVTALASDLGVRAVQRKFRCLVVIKAHRFPFLAVVARFAFGAVAAIVNIADAVTIDARGANALPALIGMACSARYFDVRANESKFCFAVIESVGWLPGDNAVTALAGFSEPALVGIILVVAGIAFGRGLGPLFASHMTALASGRRVCAFQCKIGQIVPERLFIEAGDTGFAALVVGMAMAAFGVFDGWMFAVKARFCGEVGGDRLMAVKTKLLLGAFGKR